MPRPGPRPSGHDLRRVDLAGARAFARRLAPSLVAGDVIGLSGPLGAGKTTLARLIILARAEGEGIAIGEVPSPTFTMVQTYAFRELEIWHFDLYRLEAPEDAFELAIEEAFARAASLIEWPERLGPYLPEDRLDVEIAFTRASSARKIRLTGRGAWAARTKELVACA